MTGRTCVSDKRIGVVLIGRNEGDRLIKALASVGLGVHGVVYVDSGSTDDSVVGATRAGATVVRLDTAKPFTAARARNAGFAELLARDPAIELVQFVDGDCELDPGWLGAAAAFLAAHPEIAVVCGRRRESYPERSIYNKICDIEWDTPVGEAEACGGDFLIKVESFQKVGGFRERMIAGEEPELCVRLRASGWKVWRLGAEMTRHDANILHLWQWWRRSVRSGYAYATLVELHGDGPDAFKKRHVRSAVLWGGALPLLIVAGALAYPPVVATAVIYPLQALRIGLRSAYKGRDGLIFGAQVVCSKMAECTGVAKFALARIRGREQALIEYK